MTNNNLITKYGWRALLNRYVSDASSYKPPLYFKVGYSQADITVTSTALTNPVPIYGAETIDSCDATGWSELNDALAEVLDTTSGNFKQGTGCLDLGKTATTSVNFGYEKNQVGKNFSSKKLLLWLYIADTDDLAETNAVQILFGSDSFNYYYKYFDKSDLSDGWNEIVMEQSTASVQGSPLVTACTYTSIRFQTPLSTDTITSGDIRMDFWILAGSDDYKKAFTTTPPTVDETDFEISYECFLDTDEAVGYLLNGFVIVDEDGNVHSIDKFEGSSKGPTDQFTFEVVDRIEQ